MSFLFGDSGSAPKAFRAPGWKDQFDLLNQLFIGNALGANPGLMEGVRSNIGTLESQLAELQKQYNASGQSTSGQNPQGYYGGPQSNNNTSRDAIKAQINSIQNALNTQRGFINQYDNRDNVGLSFTPGQAIAGQYQSNIGNAPALSFQQATPYQFSNPTQNFQMNLTPFNAQQAVGDAFTPQAQNLENIFNRRGKQEDQAILEDLNSRGLLTTGATTKALSDRRVTTNDALSNALAQLAGQQASQVLGANQFGTQSQLAQQQALLGSDQFRQQQDFNRQINQAAELFRQQGASDQQAMAMAQDALSRAQIGFNQNLQGRQAGLNEIGLQNQFMRQPQEDLLRLASLSAGASPGSAPQPGLLQGLAQGAGQAAIMAPFLFCLPEGTEIETEEGAKPVEKMRPGDQVKGGTVIATSMRLRRPGHKFYRHEFENGQSVVMSKGHPFYDELESLKVENHSSPYTYDILTDSGFYIVNGVKLGSTILG